MKLKQKREWFLVGWAESEIDVGRSGTSAVPFGKVEIK